MAQEQKQPRKASEVEESTEAVTESDVAERKEALDDATERALLVGQDVSDQNGVVRLLLPQQ